MSGERRQGRYWILTIPQEQYTPFLPPNVVWSKGQLEQGEGGFLHWQIVVLFSKKVSLSVIRSTFGPVHGELTRSDAAENYVWKEETRVSGTQFILGLKPFKRNSVTDWDNVWTAAQSGDLLAIEADVRIRYYRTFCAIASDFAQAIAVDRTIYVFWGVTGTGKSRRAWEEAGLQAYPKDPRSKFWCGYINQVNVVLDEFRGGIDISHMLRWTDRYPVQVEIKGSSRPLLASTIWITSNLHPMDWYPDIDPQTKDALMRRLNITEFT